MYNRESQYTGIIQTEQGFLRFENRDAFDQICEELSEYTIDHLTEWAIGLELISLSECRSNGSELDQDNNTRCDDYLWTSLIDRYGLIQIGNYIYKSETDLDIAWSMSVDHMDSDLSNLITRNYVAEKMNIFNSSFDLDNDIDIIEFVETGRVGVNKINSFKPRAVHGYKHKPTPADECQQQGEEKGICNRGDAKAVYQNFIIYHSLYTELKTYKKSANGNTWVPFSTLSCMIGAGGQSDCGYVKRNSNTWTYKVKNSCNTGYHIDWRPYQGTRRLKSFYLNGNYRFDCPATAITRYHHAGIYY